MRPTKGRGAKRVSRDPDPLVIDLLVNLGATALASLLVKIGRILFRGREPLGPAPDLTPDTLGVLDARITDLEQLLDRASHLITQDCPRELGAMLLLDPEKLREYHEIREALVRHVQALDDLTDTIFADYQPEGGQLKGVDRRLPQEFKAQMTFLEKRLREARVASIAEEAFLEMTATIGALGRLLEQIRVRASRPPWTRR